MAPVPHQRRHGQRPRISIIGAGPGGLASALLLSRSGAEVTVFEAADCPGGRTSTFSQEGFTWDLGATFFMYPRILAEILSSVGRDLTAEIPMIKLDPHYRLLFSGGGEITASPDIAKLKEQIARYSPDDAAQVDRFLADNREKLARFRPILEKSFCSLRDFADPRILGIPPRLLRPLTSVDADLRRYFRDERTRLAFSFQTKYLGMSPFRCPSLFTILSFLEYEHGIFHPVGGCGAVTRALARMAEENGVKIRLSEPVEEIFFEGTRATGVRTATGRHECDALVMNSDFAHTMSALVPDRLRRRWNDQRISRAKFSCSTFMMYLGLKGECATAHHTIRISDDYQGNLRDIEDRHVLSENPSFYVQNPCVTDQTMAPRGQTALYVLVPVTHQHGNVDWRKEMPAMRRRVFGLLPQAGIEDAEKRIVCERVFTPDDWASQRIHLGATFNLAHNLGQMLYWRPHNRFEDLKGVYLVGGGTHPGSGLPVIFESARISTALLARDLGLDLRLQGESDAAAVPVSDVPSESYRETSLAAMEVTGRS